MSRYQTIFISDIDSALSYHVIEQLRDDHKKLKNYTRFIGVFTTQDIKHRHSNISKIYNIQTDKVTLYRHLLQCSTFIVWAHSIDKQMHNIMKIAQERGRLELPTKIIVISSYMVWARSRPKLNNVDKTDKEQIVKILQQSMDYKLEEKYYYHQHQFLQRRPMSTHLYHYQMQQYALQLNNYQSIQANVICSGLIYGKNFPQKWMHNLLNKAYQQQNLVCYGSGNNILPTVHIDDLVKMIACVLNSDNTQKYYLAVDSQPCRQIQLLKTLKKISGNMSQIKFQQLYFFNECQIIMSQHLLLKKTNIQQNQQVASRSCIEYFNKNMQQIDQYMDIGCRHLLIGEYAQCRQEQLQIIRKHYPVIQINNQLYDSVINKYAQNEQQKADGEYIMRKLFEEYVQPLKYCHFVLIDRKNIGLSEQLCQKYGIVKTNKQKLAQTQIQYLSQQFWDFLKIVSPLKLVTPQSIQNDHQAQQNMDEDELANKLQKQSEAELGVQDDQKQQSEQEQIVDNRDQQNWRNKTGKIDQYLLDNVLGYISEAYSKIQPAPTLTHLIKQLHQIYNKQLAQASDD